MTEISEKEKTDLELVFKLIDCLKLFTKPKSRQLHATSKIKNMNTQAENIATFNEILVLQF